MSVKIDIKKCDGYGNDIFIYAVEAIEIKNGKASVNKNCLECAACISFCFNGAITL